MRLPIRFYGDPILRKKSEEIQEITPAIRQLVADMIETMDKENGAGLAAPQVGHSLRLFVLRDYITREEDRVSRTEPKVFINPKLSTSSKTHLLDAEGFLSIPGVR